jgi:hypothetical protein
MDGFEPPDDLPPPAYDAALLAYARTLRRLPTGQHQNPRRQQEWDAVSTTTASHEGDLSSSTSSSWRSSSTDGESEKQRLGRMFVANAAAADPPRHTERNTLSTHQQIDVQPLRPRRRALPNFPPPIEEPRCTGPHRPYVPSSSSSLPSPQSPSFGAPIYHNPSPAGHYAPDNHRTVSSPAPPPAAPPRVWTQTPERLPEPPPRSLYQQSKPQPVLYSQPTTSFMPPSSSYVPTVNQFYQSVYLLNYNHRASLTSTSLSSAVAAQFSPMPAPNR